VEEFLRKRPFALAGEELARNDLKAGISLILLALACGSASALEPSAIFERVAPSVWVVNTVDAQGRQFTVASAVVIAPGRLITNCHVVDRAKGIKVRKDSVDFDATLEYSDAQRDLCQLIVRNFYAPALTLAPMQTLKVGQRVYAIASPRGQELSISEGIVSSLRNTTDGSPLIQTSTAVTSGSSGGGLFDAEARLVGITTYTASEGPTTNYGQPADWIHEVPERAKAALALRQSQAVATAAPSGTAASPYPRALTGDDLIGHFRGIKKVEVIAPTKLYSLTFGPGNRFEIVHQQNRSPNGDRQQGTYTVGGGENSHVCFRLPSYTSIHSSGSGWDWMSDCFRVLQTNEKTYSLTTPKGDYSFSYAVP
jgi:S1-C subfamily serine protease